MRVFYVLLVLTLLSCSAEQKSEKNATPNSVKLEYAMVIHGGAGDMSEESMDNEKIDAYKSMMNAVLSKGKEILSSGGGSLDAVEQCIKMMENSPLFNAGKGAVFTSEGKNELDASIMVGADMRAGAVAGVTRVKNPISAARAVMERTKHVMLCSTGADVFAEQIGLEMVDPKYFMTEDKLNSFNRARKNKVNKESDAEKKGRKMGTVGVVALDKYGQICAGTSTGGMTNKKWGRIGDSPIIGAGTYANNNFAGVSCTGHGEYFIRYAVAYDIIAQMKYGNKSLEEASKDIIHNKLESVGGKGGIIALDAYGNISTEFNTKSMFRGYMTPNERDVKIFKD